MVEIGAVLDTVLKYAVAPIGAFVWWLFKKYDLRIDVVESKINLLERDNAVLNTKLDNLKEDMTEIKATLNTLIAMLQNRDRI